MHISQPTPELPVPDVEEAQAYYRDRLGFTVAWHDEAAGLGAVAHGDCAIFLRRTSEPGAPATFWVYSEDVDAACRELTDRGADIVAPIRDTPWGLRQFTIRDRYGNRYHFHHDL